ncbi:MAG: SpoIIE family protein phosphatase [Clostridia bacterium]|nr:SpoIIE family protein phosphatase [Clostridia bacterium]
MAGMFFILSLTQCVTVPSTFTISALLALLSEGVRPKGAFAGLVFGLVFRVLWRLPLDAGQFGACLFCWLLIRLIRKTEGQLYLLLSALLIGRAFPDIIVSPDGQTVILYASGAVLGLASFPAFRRCARILRDRPAKISQDELLCLYLPFLLLIAGLSRLSVFDVNLGYLWAAICVLTISWLCGGAWGMCMGLGCGLALLVSGQSALLLVNLSFGAVMAGLFQGRSKALAAIVYFMASIVSTYLIASMFYPFLLAAEALAGVGFCLIPARIMNRMGRRIRRVSWFAPRENAYMRMKIDQWLQAVDQIADALPTPRVAPVEQEEECEAIAEALCAECERLPMCWQGNVNQAQTGLEALTARNGGAEDYLEVINRYFSQCPRISRLPELLNQLDEDRTKRMRQAICAEYEQDILRTHLAAVTQSVQAITLEGGEESEEAVWLSKSEAALQSLHFPGHSVFAKHENGHLLLGLRCDPLTLPLPAGDDLAARLSLQLRMPLAIVRQEQDKVVLEEEPPMVLSTGTATACAVNKERVRHADRRPDNGDAILARRLPGGYALIALSDGMGHGAGAQEESKKTLELLSLCLEAGYSRSQAMKAVNGAMLSATGGEKFATVDLCVTNLWTGETVMNKLGACASFILQGQKMHTVEGAALPLGIIEHAAPMEHSFTLGEGDVLLLVSDGVTDAFPGEEEIPDIIKQKRNENPQQIADALLREALLRQNGLPPDDMTVLCAKVTARERRKK